MLRVDRILGNQSEPDFGKELHRLEHIDGLDMLILPSKELARRRLRMLTEKGQEVAISLARDQKLFDGAILVLDQTHALVVRVDAENWLRVKTNSRSAALQLGFHAGNLHWRVKFDDDELLIAIENELQTYLDRLALLIESGLISPVLSEDQSDG